ncbi:TetR/AcrR family transcriptional regulator [Pseudonocardia sp. GCM10023141]|uniref:TetR/AcrR family transcriptional regulator n=1 Tax=Pseudonocardia sp. GCM10023141 TaxID=3252653 RepID=UPI003624093C
MRSSSGPVSAELIEQEAVRLFGERTYPVVGMRDIGDAVGLLPGSLYVHISSKEELLLRIVERGIQNYLDAITPVVESGEPAAARLRGAISAHMSVLAATVEQTRVAVHQWTYLSSENQKQVAAMRNRYEELFDRILREGIASGDFRAMPHPRVAVLSTIGMLNSVTEWYSPDGSLTAADIGEALADNALVGLQQP